MTHQPRTLFQKTIVPATTPDAPGFYVETRQIVRQQCRESLTAMIARLQQGQRARSKRRHGYAITTFDRRWDRIKAETRSVIIRAEQASESAR